MSNQVDDKLREWAEKRQPSEAHMAKLGDRIRTAASQERHQRAVSDSALSIGFLQRLSSAALGAVVALIAVFAFLYLTRVPTGSGPAANGPAGLVAFTEKQKEAHSRLFKEMRNLFPDGLTWVAESNGDVGLGIESLVGGYASDGDPILVRLAVVSKTDADSEWRSVWNADVMVRGEEVVEVVPNKNSENKLAFWVYPLSDGKIAIDSEVALNLEMPFSARRSMVVRQGEVTEIMCMSENGVQYKLLQTVTKLNTNG